MIVAAQLMPIHITLTAAGQDVAAAGGRTPHTASKVGRLGKQAANQQSVSGEGGGSFAQRRLARFASAEQLSSRARLARARLVLSEKGARVRSIASRSHAGQQREMDEE
jgi:hypothetical protein